MRITEMLNQLSLASGILRIADAENIAVSINKRLRSLIGADVVKMYWKAGATNGFFLNPFGVDKTNNSENPKPFFVNEAYQGGILCWVLKYRHPVWLEKMRDLTGDRPAENNFPQAPQQIEKEYLKELKGNRFNSMIAVPLFYEQNEPVGVYSVEFTRSIEISEELLYAFRRLGEGLARLYWEAYVTESSMNNTNKALNNFLNDLSDDDLESEFVPPSGFIARPFEGDEFAELEKRLRSLLRKEQIQARSYKPQGHHAIVIQEITTQIKRCHFGIADITGSNPNVMTEVGMMMALEKRILLLRRKDDSLGRPFNVSGYDVHDYQLVPDSADIETWSYSSAGWEPLELTLREFVKQFS
jgi:hypothetical protein